MKIQLTLDDYEIALIKHSLNATIEYLEENKDGDIFRLDGEKSTRELLIDLMNKLK